MKGAGCLKKRALLSVSDKRGILDFARFLISLDFEILSTGGTYALLQENGIAVTQVSKVTDFPEMLDGRVKTLHPAIHGGLLAKRDSLDHVAQIQKAGILPIDIVVVNLYPFANTIKQAGVTEEMAIEQIDIGGPAMLRSSAKNHASVTVVVDPDDYQMVQKALETGDTTLTMRRDLAAKVFRHTAAYDSLIAQYFTKELFPQQFTVTYEKKQDLRYGENPQQQAALYEMPIHTGGILSATQLQGKELSYNNIADADTALFMVSEFQAPTAVAIKHANPCGVGCGESILEAYENAYLADPVSIFGGIVAVNREVDETLAQKLMETFLEIIIAPHFTQTALEVLAQKPNLRLLQIEMPNKVAGLQLSTVGGGLLVQEQDRAVLEEDKLTIPTQKKPTSGEMQAAKFAWTVVKYVKSNAIVLANETRTLGIGPGQTNRVGAADIAIRQAGNLAKGAVLASDAFFPMADTVELAAKAGVSVIIQPGGSIKDAEVIEACDKHGIAMIMTGTRHFRH